MYKIKKQTIVRYIYDGEDIIAEYDAGDALIAKYIHGPGIDEPILLNSKFQIPDSKFYYHFDGLGSVAAVTNEAGAIVESYEYDAFGNTTIRNTQGVILTTSQIDNRYMFTGREYDNESGLYYYRARYYDPAIGRFLQEDPIWGTNLYSYVDNNPVNYVDPWGLQQVLPQILLPQGLNISIDIDIVDVPLPLQGTQHIPGGEIKNKSTESSCLNKGEKKEQGVFFNKKEGEEIKERGKRGPNGEISRIRKIKDIWGNIKEVWHEVLDKNGNIIHRDWKGPGSNPYVK